MYNIQAERETSSSSFGYIVKDIKNLKDDYIKLGFHLHEFKKYKASFPFGYETFESFCEANFALDKSEINNVIQMSIKMKQDTFILWDSIRSICASEFASWIVSDGKKLVEKSYLKVLSALKKEQIIQVGI